MLIVEKSYIYANGGQNLEGSFVVRCQKSNKQKIKPKTQKTRNSYTVVGQEVWALKGVDKCL